MQKLKREPNREELTTAESPAKKPSVEPGESLMDLFNDLADMAATIPFQPTSTNSNPSRSPSEDHLPKPPLSEITKTSYSALSKDVKSFLWDHVAIFDDLINLSSPSKFVDYLDENPTSYRYYGRLYNTLIALTEKHADEKLVRNVRRKSTGERLKKIDIEKLLKKLKPCQSDEAQEFLSVINEGISSWRLLKLFNIYDLAENEKKHPIIDALIWLEKRRSFMKACTSRDRDLMEWLDKDQQSEMKAFLTEFTIALQNLFSQTKDFSIIEKVMKRKGKTVKFEVCLEPVIYKIPLIMDIRMLWHTFIFNSLIEPLDHIENYEQLLIDGNDFIIRDKSLTKFFSSIYPCPLTCFLEAVNGLEKELRSDETLKVDHDVLMWLFLSHQDNAELSNTILSRSAGVDVVAQAYTAHQKEPMAASLAESMASILSPIHNSPIKEKRKPEPELQFRSPKRKIEHEPIETHSPQIK